MKKQLRVRTAAQAGISLIEFIVVLVVIAVAIVPRYTSVFGDANQDAANAMGEKLAAASANNTAIRSGGGKTGAAVNNCGDIGNLLGGLPTGYTIGAKAIAANETATCTLTSPGPITATFTGHGAT